MTLQQLEELLVENLIVENLIVGNLTVENLIVENLILENLQNLISPHYCSTYKSRLPTGTSSRAAT